MNHEGITTKTTIIGCKMKLETAKTSIFLKGANPPYEKKRLTTGQLINPSSIRDNKIHTASELTSFTV